MHMHMEERLSCCTKASTAGPPACPMMPQAEKGVHVAWNPRNKEGGRKSRARVHAQVRLSHCAKASTAGLPALPVVPQAEKGVRAAWGPRNKEGGWRSGIHVRAQGEAEPPHQGRHSRPACPSRNTTGRKGGACGLGPKK